MYLCHCRAVTDRRVRAAIEAGAHDTGELGRRCGAGTRCGGCLSALESLLAEWAAAPAAPPRPVGAEAA